MYYTYILHYKTLNRFYVGFSSYSVEDRLKKHLAKQKGFTNKADDWEIAYTENYSTKAEAMNREKQIKNWKSNKMIKNLIASTE